MGIFWVRGWRFVRGRRGLAPLPGAEGLSSPRRIVGVPSDEVDEEGRLLISVDAEVPTVTPEAGIETAVTIQSEESHGLVLDVMSPDRVAEGNTEERKAIRMIVRKIAKVRRVEVAAVSSFERPFLDAEVVVLVVPIVLRTLIRVPIHVHRALEALHGGGDRTVPRTSYSS